MRIKVHSKLRYILPCTSASSVHVSRDADNGERAGAGGAIAGAGETAARAGAMVMAGEYVCNDSGMWPLVGAVAVVVAGAGTLAVVVAGVDAVEVAVVGVDGVGAVV